MLTPPHPKTTLRRLPPWPQGKPRMLWRKASPQSPPNAARWVSDEERPRDQSGQCGLHDDTTTRTHRVTHIHAYTPVCTHTRVTHIHVHTPVSHPHLCANVPVTPIPHPCLTHISHTSVHTHLCHSPHLSHTHPCHTHPCHTDIPHTCVHTHLSYTHHTRVAHTPVSHTHHTHVTHSYPTPVYTHTRVTHTAARPWACQSAVSGSTEAGGRLGGLERSLDPLGTPFQSSGQAATRSRRKASVAPAKSRGCSRRIVLGEQ